jgi:hypothetical protein
MQLNYLNKLLLNVVSLNAFGDGNSAIFKIHRLFLAISISIYAALYIPWSLTLREEHRLRVFENKVLRRIFGPKRDEVTGGWRILHNEELRDLYYSLSIIRLIKSRRMRWAGHVARMGEKINKCV